MVGISTTGKSLEHRKAKTALYLIGCMTLVESELAWAGGGGGLTEVENTATWVLNIFSPALLLVLLTLLLIGAGLAVYFGKLSGQLFVKILVGSVLVFGSRTIAPKIIALF